MGYETLNPFIALIVFAIVGAGMAIAPLILSRLLRPSKPSKEKLMAYECGEIPIGEAKLTFEYYAYAALFLIFEIATVFLFLFVFSPSIIYMYPFMAVLLVCLFYFIKEKKWVEV